MSSPVTPVAPGKIWSIHHLTPDTYNQVDEWVVEEEPLEIVVNGQAIALLMRMPGQEKELAAGFCISEGYIQDVRDILIMHHCGLGHAAPDETAENETFSSRNRVEMRVIESRLKQPQRAETRLIRSGCGAVDISAFENTLPRLTTPLSIQASTLLTLERTMRKHQIVHRKIGGTHAAAIFDKTGYIVTAAEDIGRHNAVDKVVGHCLLRDIPLANKLLVTTGRASYEMVNKTIRAGMAVLASASAPTGLAVALAKEHGLTLIGYLCSKQMKVYTHAQRIID